MKEYRFEEISLGLSESFQVEITREMMDKFRDISGDVNPFKDVDINLFAQHTAEWLDNQWLHYFTP